ncbi:MAG: glycerophosphodiester phosphodiesterase [Proteobacteria bacterium]|nr:MAG: glycerophosphodiester phosphodiesterase [Pseudomonadota bacterium]
MKTAPTFDQLRATAEKIHIHGHRGARGILPENTLEGFRFTFDIGVRVIELDVLMSADGVPVITHNPVLLADATRDSQGHWLDNSTTPINSLSVAELQALDVGGLRSGSSYAKRFPDQAFVNGLRIPTLEAVCQLIQQPEYQDVWLNLEIKSAPIFPGLTPEPAAYMTRVLEVIRQYQLQNRIILQSFDWRIVHESKRQEPDIPRSYLSYASTEGHPLEVNIGDGSPWMDGLSLADYDNSLPQLVAAADGQVWAPNHRDLTEQAMREARECGLMVNVWTVNEIADIDRMVALGVDGIITDYPGRVQRRLLDHGFAVS